MWLSVRKNNAIPFFFQMTYRIPLLLYHQENGLWYLKMRIMLFYITYQQRTSICNIKHRTLRMLLTTSVALPYNFNDLLKFQANTVENVRKRKQAVEQSINISWITFEFQQESTSLLQMPTSRIAEPMKILTTWKRFSISDCNVRQ